MAFQLPHKGNILPLKEFNTQLHVLFKCTLLLHFCMEISFDTSDPKRPHTIPPSQKTQLFSDPTNLPILYWHVCQQLGRKRGRVTRGSRRNRWASEQVSWWAGETVETGGGAKRSGTQDSRSSHLSHSISVWCVRQGLWHFIKLRDSQSSSLLLPSTLESFSFTN